MDTSPSFDSPGLAVPPSSFNSVQMPDVFVIPPEEEQAETPPFCYFDASKAALSTEPDIDSVDIALNVHQQIANTAPVFFRTSEEVVMPVRRSEDEPSSPISQSRSEDEDDIVEVYKVGKEIPSVAGKKENMSRSKTFRARASQALRSIKNVGKISRKQPAPVQTLPSPPPKGENVGPTTPSVASRTGRNTLSNRRSRPLSQIFRFGPAEEHETVFAPSSPTATVRPTSPAFSVASSPMSPTSPTRSSMQSSIIGSLRPLSPSPQPGSSRPTSPIHYDDSPTSPDSVRSKSTFRKRLSLLELPRLFSSSSTVSTSSSTSTPSTASLEDPPSDIPPTPLPSTASLARRSSKSSSKRSWTMSRPGDDDNEEEDYGEVRPAAFLSMVKEEDSYVNDISLEMRLDSLHFESLSFDPNDFTMSSIRGHGTQIEVN